MQEQVEDPAQQDPAQEVKRLQRCINDLISVLALPATWIGTEPSRIVETLLDALLRMLRLEFAYARLNDAFGAAPVEVFRIAGQSKVDLPLHELRKILGDSPASDASGSLAQIRGRIGDGDISIFPVPLGIHGEIGAIVLGCNRASFPEKTESLLLNVAASQAAIGLKEAHLLRQQRQLAMELDQRVAQRTSELTAKNEELRQARAALQKALVEIQNSEARLRQVIDAIPTLAWCNLPDGPNEFLNKGWHEYTGLSPEESHGWGWTAAFHPEDLPPLMERWRKMLLSGESDEIEARLRRHDGVYRWFLIRAQAFRDESGKIVRWYGTSTDIEDRKRSEVRKAAVIDSALDCIVTIDHEGRITEFNPAAEQTFGYRRYEVLGKHLADTIIPPSLREKHRQGFARFLATGETRLLGKRIEMTGVRANGSEFPLELAIARVPVEGPPSFTGYLRDITERKRSEDAIRAAHARVVRSEEKWRSVFESSAVGVALADLNFRFIAANSVFQEILGYTEQELQELTFMDITHEEYRNHNEALVRELLAGQRQQFMIEKQCRRKDGTSVWVRNSVSIVPGSERVPGFLMALSEDITERKQAEEKLRASENSLKQIINTIPANAWSAQADGDADFVNQRWLDYTGLSMAQARGWGWAQAVHPDDLDRLKDYWLSIIATGKPGEIEARLRRFDGNHRWFLFRANPVRDESGTIIKWYGTNTDIDDRKRAGEELRNAQSELARMTRVMTMGQLTASIAHEVNQPLSGIITNASTCLRMLDANPPNLDGARETTRRTIRDGNRASDVITRLRTLYSKKEPALESMDLNEAAREVTELSSAEIQRNGVTLRQEFADDLPLALGDRVQLQQVILNLLRNAADAMSTIDDRPRELLLKTERDRGNQIRLSVKDSGIGFTPQAADRIFEAFYTTKSDGMGIGLSISRSIIEAHQGRLWATRNDGPGSTFSFSIPCRPEGLPDARIRLNRPDPSADAA